MSKSERRRQSKINKRNHRQKNRVVNKKSKESVYFPLEFKSSADEKFMKGLTINPDGTYTHKDAHDGGGSVRLDFPNGDKYEGGLNEDLIPHGKGTLTHKDGGKFEGEFANGKRHGTGKLTYSNGGTLEGSWINGEVKGEGSFDIPEVGKFVGEFENASPKHGRIMFPDGILYEGEFRDWKPNGNGRQTFPDGEKYEGQFKDGLYHGGGTYYRKNGHSMCGEWKDNKPSKEEYMTYWDSYPCDPKLDSCILSQGGKVVKVYGEEFKKFLLEMDNNFSEVLI